MKKTLTLIALLLVAATGMAQGAGSPPKDKNMEALISEAISRGMSQDGTYCIDNRKNKAIDVATAEKYMRAKGYNVASSSTKEYMRFGEPIKILDKLTFFDPNSFHLFAFNRLKGNNHIEYGQLNKKGAFLYIDKLLYVGSDNAEYELGNNLGNGVCLCDNVLWSGSVVNGLLDGHGVGFIENEYGYNYFECDFKSGFPVSAFKTQLFLRSNNKTRELNRGGKAYTRQTIANISVDYVNGRVRSSEVLKKALMGYAQYYYVEDARQIELDYNKLLELNRNIKYNYNSTLADVFINLYGSLNMDPENLLPKAREIHDVQYVRRIENEIWMKNYIDYNSYTEKHSFDWEGARADTLALWNAIQLATQKVNAGAQNPFNGFWREILKTLKVRRGNLLHNIEEQRRKLAGVQQEENEYRSAMCDNCKIDGDKSTVPIGCVEGSWFFGIPIQSEKKGIIVMHNGKTVKWWFEWSGSTKVVKVESDWLGYYKFNTEQEMMQEIIRVCKGKYCN